MAMRSGCASTKPAGSSPKTIGSSGAREVGADGPDEAVERAAEGRRQHRVLRVGLEALEQHGAQAPGRVSGEGGRRQRDEVVVEVVARVPAVVPEARAADRAGDEDDAVLRPGREEAGGEALGDQVRAAVALGGRDLGRRRDQPALLRHEAHRVRPGAGAVGVVAADHVALAGEREHPGRRHRAPYGSTVKGSTQGASPKRSMASSACPSCWTRNSRSGFSAGFAVGPDPRAGLGVAAVLGEHRGRDREGQRRRLAGGERRLPVAEALEQARHPLLADHVLVVEVHGLGAGAAAGVGHPDAGGERACRPRPKASRCRATSRRARSWCRSSPRRSSRPPASGRRGRGSRRTSGGAAGAMAEPRTTGTAGRSIRACRVSKPEVIPSAKGSPCESRAVGLHDAGEDVGDGVAGEGAEVRGPEDGVGVRLDLRRDVERPAGGDEDDELRAGVRPAHQLDQPALDEGQPRLRQRRRFTAPRVRLAEEEHDVRRVAGEGGGGGRFAQLFAHGPAVAAARRRSRTPRA